MAVFIMLEITMCLSAKTATFTMWAL